MALGIANQKPCEANTQSSRIRLLVYYLEQRIAQPQEPQ